MGQKVNIPNQMKLFCSVKNFLSRQEISILSPTLSLSTVRKIKSSSDREKPLKFETEDAK